MGRLLRVARVNSRFPHGDLPVLRHKLSYKQFLPTIQALFCQRGSVRLLALRFRQSRRFCIQNIGVSVLSHKASVSE